MDVARGILRLIGLHEFFTFKALYFLMYSGFGVLSPYAPVYYELMNLTKAQIGILTMMPNFCSFLVAPIFSAISDMLHAHYEIMVICMITSTLAMTTTLLCGSFGNFVVVTLITSILRAPVSPNVDALVIASLSDKTRYGEMRLWGAISYGIFSLIGGLMTSTGNHPAERQSPQEQQAEHRAEVTAFQYVYLLHALFFIASGFLVLSIVYTQLTERDILPKIRFHTSPVSLSIVNLDEDSVKLLTTDLPPSVANSVDIQDGSCVRISGQPTSTKKISSSVSSSSNDAPGAKTSSSSVTTAFFDVFRKHPSVGVFALVVFLSGFGSGVIDAFLFLRLKQLGGTGLVMGVSRFITCASEVPMFQIAGGLHQKYGTWAMLTLTQFAFVVRFTYYSFLTIPWAILPCEVLHGLTFAVTWSVSCTFANMVSPPECHTTMQALLEGLHWGFGSGMGALVGGYLYDSVGAVRLFQFSGFLSFISLCLAAFTWMTVGRRDDKFPELSVHQATDDGLESSRDSSGLQMLSSQPNRSDGSVVYSSLLHRNPHSMDEGDGDEEEDRVYV